MIIIKTSNGDAFVNEAEMQQVEHLRDKRQVKITTRVGVRTINDVEAVLYATNISQWQDEGSQVAKLHSLVTQLEHERTIELMKAKAEELGIDLKERYDYGDTKD